MPAHALRQLPIASGDGGTPSTFSWKRFRDSLSRRFTGVGVDVFSARLVARQELRLHEVAGWTVVCRRGAIWITQESDARDIFLKGGEGFVLDRGVLALVCACRDTVLSIRPPAGRGSASRSQRAARGAGSGGFAVDDQAQLTWLRSLYPECGPWNDPASYRRSGLL